MLTGKSSVRAGSSPSSAAYKIIDPARYEAWGIEPADVLVGTVASENHPGYLLSRYGGNAFGLGLFEQAGRLGEEEARLLAGLDLDDPQTVAAQAAKINAIYERLGLFVRYSRRGKPFYLIPLAWLAHSNAEVQDRADIVEAEIRAYQREQFKEHLSIIILCPPGDLLAAELLWRFSGHRVVPVSNPAEIRQTKGPFDLALILQDLAPFLISRPPVDLGGSRPRKKTIFNLSQYLTGKLYDLLSSAGRLIMIAPRQSLAEAGSVNVVFPSEAELRNFLIFSHVFKTERRYRAPESGQRLEVALADLYAFLTREVIYRRTLERLTKGRPPADLSLEEVDRLPYLEASPKGRPFPDQRFYWTRFLEPFFEARFFDYRRLERTEELWRESLGLEESLPPTELVFAGDKRRPKVSLAEMEAEASSRGLSGCPLPLVAPYKDSFAYLLKVIGILERIKNLNFSDLPSLERARLSTPFQFKGPYAGFFKDILALTKAASKLNQLAESLNPQGMDGERTPVLNNLEKMSLLGVAPEILRELFLIVVGHSAIGRVTLGKVPERSLIRLTRTLSGLDREEVVNTLRVIRLMSVAEMAALRDGALPQAQAGEVFTLAEKVIRIASDPELNWERLQEDQIIEAGGATNWTVRRLLKLFGLFEHTGDWMELLSHGDYEKEIRAGFDDERLAKIEAVIEVAKVVRRFKERFEATPSFERPYFFKRILDFEFHGTARLLPALGPREGFKLLWMVVNLSPTIRVNFNPLLTGPPEQSFEQRVATIRDVLAGLSMEDLAPEHLVEAAEDLTPGRPVFVRHAGVAMRLDAESGVLEVSLVQVGSALKRLDELAAAAEGKPISALARADLVEMDLLFGRLEDYARFMRRRPLEEFTRSEDQRRLISDRLAEFDRVSGRLVQVLSGRLFKPEFIHDHLTRLREHAPRLFNRLVPELAEMDRLPPAHPDYLGPSMLSYFLRSASKFQALVTGNVEGFQDKNLLHLLALQEFGVEAAGGVGVTSEQVGLLLDIVDRLGGRRYLLRAVGLALVFQDIGRLPSLIERYADEIDFTDHGLASARIMFRAAILDRYPLTPKAKETAAFLVGLHGLLGRVVRGEAPIVALAAVTDRRDPDLFDAFFLQNVITLTSVREWSLTEDLFNALEWTRNQALAVAEGRRTWLEVATSWRRTAATLPAALEKALAAETPPTPARFGRLRQALYDELSPAELTEGERTAAGLERLYRLRGLWYLTFEAVALFRLKAPMAYIRRLLALSSLGEASLERALFEAVRLETEALALIPQEARRYLIERLSDIVRPVTLAGFPYLSEFLGPVNRLKAALIGLKAAELIDNGRPIPVTVSFRELEDIVSERYEFINDALAGIDIQALMSDRRVLESLFTAQEGVRLEVNPARRVVSVGFADPLKPERFRERAAAIDDIEELERFYLDRLLELQDRPENTRPLQREAKEVFETRLKTLLAEETDRIIESLLAQDSLESLFELYDQAVRNTSHTFTEIQLGRMSSAFEVRKAQLRQRLEEDIRSRLEAAVSTEDLDDLWRAIKGDLIKKHDLIGRQLERRIGRMFDVRRRRLEDERLF